MNNLMETKPSRLERRGRLMHDVKMLALGALTVLLLLTGNWMMKNYKAIVVAVTYPEVVSSLKVTKDYQVKN